MARVEATAALELGLAFDLIRVAAADRRGSPGKRRSPIDLVRHCHSALRDARDGVDRHEGAVKAVRVIG